MRRLISCSALVMICLTLSGCILEDDDPEGNSARQIADTTQSDDSSENDDTTGSDDTADTDDTTDSGDTADTDDSSDSDDTADTPTGSGDTADNGDSTDSDDTTDSAEDRRKRISDDTADTDDSSDSGDTADTGDSTDSDDTADTDDSTDTDDTTTITKYQWRSPVSLYDTYAFPSIIAQHDQVIATWHQSNDIWASVGTEGSLESSEVVNVSNSGNVSNAYYSYYFAGYLYGYRQTRFSASNSKGETCTSWQQRSPSLIRAACYSSTSGTWSDPITLYEFQLSTQLEMVALSDDRFALVVNRIATENPRTESLELAIFTPGEVQERITVDTDVAFDSVTMTPDDSAGLNLLYTSRHPVNPALNDLLFIKIDAELNLTTTILDESNTTKGNLLLTSGDNPKVSYSIYGDDETEGIYILDQTLTKIEFGDIELTSNQYPSLVLTEDGTLHYVAWQSSDPNIIHIMVKDGEVTSVDTSLLEQYTDSQSRRWGFPTLIEDGDNLYMYWGGTVESEVINEAYELFFSHYVDGKWAEPNGIICGDSPECVERSVLGGSQYAVTDDMIAIVYIGSIIYSNTFEWRGKIITTDKEPAVED